MERWYEEQYTLSSEPQKNQQSLQEYMQIIKKESKFFFELLFNIEDRIGIMPINGQ